MAVNDNMVKQVELKPEDFRKIDINDKEAEVIQRESLSAWQDAWERLRQNKMAMTALIIMLVIIIMAIVAPHLVPYTYDSNDLMSTNKPPSLEHLFGTDDFGRDVFVRTWMGARISLIVGLAAACIDLIFGVIYGGIMGFFGGRVDTIMNKFSEILYSIPYLLVVIMLLVVFEPSLWTIILALTITGWINMSWIVRGEIMQLKSREFILASRSMGADWKRLLFKHLLPNAMGPIIVTVTLSVPSAIFSEAFLSFLGLGVQAPVASLGSMINDSLTGWLYYPWRMIFPALVISLTMLSFNIFGDGLRDALDPKLKK
ncbi:MULTISPECIES: ABC transporter permease [Paenibacillus]|uniref:Oligopeptide transport system permease protein n=1 Tax=Paenibacillus typhae TaxID=1174501 RepID=A0A1G8HU98_9BACL|nr:MULTISPECIES: ABC transporter permease [Paenibacillus]MDF9843227.1 oligopeptide transport system permease protein [Paenibacillus sp. PastF-2]MDF9849815.1 oligopeptide transport system permease protein [Paenibacillus sp. PastM-2]MDF9856522.1 oligopeptide transport system permease protein [Paenibacillus sp. PastF-1]MDH6481792.1 oligopeptide transport system permease protein [Paenibacillus sp. PastH-2]MDH6509118.1 oligopeptide transport system permease protein [Paenibacillus sp. PastM-3]